MSLRTIFKTQLTDVDTTAKDTVGSLRWKDDKLYKYVQIKNVTTASGVAGDPVAYFASTGFTNSRVVIHLADADAQPIGAGLLCGTVTGTGGTAYYGWIQVRGEGTVPTAIQGTPVIGSGVMMDTTNKRLTKATGVIFPVGVALDTTAANNRIICNFPY